MTSAELYRLRGIDDEIERVREKIRKAKARAESTVGTIHDTPSSAGNTADKVGDGAAEIVYLKNMLAQLERKKQARDRYINGIGDAKARDAVRMVYVDCMSWRAAAAALEMSESGIRKKVRRYAK